MKLICLDHLNIGKIQKFTCSLTMSKVMLQVIAIMTSSTFKPYHPYILHESPLLIKNSQFPFVDIPFRNSFKSN